MVGMSSRDKDSKPSVAQQGSDQEEVRQVARESLFGEGMIAIARVGQIGRAKDAFVGGMNRLFGEGNWAIGYTFENTVIDREEALQLYEDSYVKFFISNGDLLQRLTREARDVYDNSKSDVVSGLDWHKQEGKSTHLQDIAIRRALKRLGEEFRGQKLVKVKSDGHFPELSPGRVPFVHPHAVNGNAVVEKKWIEPNSVEDFWQNNKVMLVKNDATVINRVTERLKEITTKHPPEDQDRFEARRAAQFLALEGRLDAELFDSFIDYTERIDRLGTLRDWTFNTIEMAYSQGFDQQKESLSEKTLQLIGSRGIYLAERIDGFYSEIFDRVGELSPVVRTSLCLAFLEGQDSNYPDASDTLHTSVYLVSDLLDNKSVTEVIRGSLYYQARLKNIFGSRTPLAESYREILRLRARLGAGLREHSIPAALEEFL